MAQAIAVIYTDDRPAADQLPALIDAAADTAGLSVLDHLLVTGGRWISLACADPGCCPPEGTPTQHTGQAAAAAVYAGLAVLADRDALASMFNSFPSRSDLAAELQHHGGVQLDEAIVRGRALIALSDSVILMQEIVQFATDLTASKASLRMPRPAFGTLSEFRRPDQLEISGGLIN